MCFYMRLCAVVLFYALLLVFICMKAVVMHLFMLSVFKALIRRSNVLCMDASANNI